MERSKVINPEYSIDRDQPTSRASPLRINDLLSRAAQYHELGLNFGTTVPAYRKSLVNSLAALARPFRDFLGVFIYRIRIPLVFDFQPTLRIGLHYDHFDPKGA